ncbi:outer membrane protein [Actibacterium sp. D379-3]
MKTLPIFAALTLAASPALAGNLTPAPAEPVITTPAPVFTPASDWTGAYAGAQIAYGNFDTSGDVDVDGDGVLGGIHAGYNYDFGSYVLGGELEYNAADISLSGGGDISDLSRLKLRGGYDMGKTLIYGTLGASYAEIDLGSGSDDDSGYFVGFGAEHMMTENVSLGGELVYDKFDDFGDSNTDIENTSLAARVSFHF